MQSPAFEQTDFRGREDDGGESAATWIATTNTNWTQYFASNFRIRLAVAETNGAMENNVIFQLQYNLNSAGWNDVTTSSSVVQAVGSTHFTNGDATTQQITTNTFISGEMSDDGLSGNVNNIIDYNGGETTEVEYNLNFVNTDVGDSDTVQFRVVRSDGTTITYTNTPTVTVDTAQTVGAATASVSASAVSPTAAETKTIGGTCALDGTAVSGATVFVVNATDDTVEVETTSDASGNWTASVPTGKTYHAAAQYDDGSTKYNEYSKPFLVT